VPSLHRRVVLARSGRRRSVAAHGVGHKPDIDATIVGTPRGGLVRLNRLVFAEADHIDLVSGHVVLGGQVLDHRVGAALAQIAAAPPLTLVAGRNP